MLTQTRAILECKPASYLFCSVLAVQEEEREGGTKPSPVVPSVFININHVQRCHTCPEPQPRPSLQWKEKVREGLYH